MNKKIYIAEIRDEETNKLLTRISSYSEEGLEEEMGKKKWTNFVGENDQQKDFTFGEETPESVDAVLGVGDEKLTNEE